MNDLAVRKSDGMSCELREEGGMCVLPLPSSAVRVKPERKPTLACASLHVVCLHLVRNLEPTSTLLEHRLLHNAITMDAFVQHFTSGF